jgi:hypothetical protein
MEKVRGGNVQFEELSSVLIPLNNSGVGLTASLLAFHTEPQSYSTWTYCHLLPKTADAL